MTVSFAMSTPEAETERKALFRTCFHTTDAETDFFFAAAYPHTRCVECRIDGSLAGAAYLMPATVCGMPGYYGYAVGTFPAYRGRGVCREIHRFILELCDAENACYFLHPASAMLFPMYAGFGLSLCGTASYIEAEAGAARPALLRNASVSDFLRGERAIRWSEELLSFAIEQNRRDGGFVKTFFSGTSVIGKAEKGELTVEVATAPLTPSEWAALQNIYKCRKMKIRLPSGEIPFVMGYRVPTEELHLDFTME
ncbi:MAG: GNAT family N-acetyltransferase [Ruminococcus sp.]|nr:GNAT family N-acetyltransferase [Candidatus Apopatosoma intestinale]